MKKSINPTHFISLYLDTRRENEKGTYPVRLRVFTKAPRKQKLFSTKFKLTEKEFQSAWETVKPRNEYKYLRSELQAVITKAEETADSISPFSFEAFEKKLFVKSDENLNVFHQYEMIVQKLRENKQFGSADNYEQCSKSLQDYIKQKLRKESSKLHFAEVTPAWLKKYESYMTEEKGRSHTTVSMYLRTLRTLFNNAIAAKDLEIDFYPFGRNKYQVPAARNIKKALGKDILKKLYEAATLNFEEERAKDIFFFSYNCNGMNIKDIAELKFENLRGDSIYLIRAKTKNTSKGNLKQVVIPLTEFTKGIIKKYSSKNQHSDNYIFPFLSSELTAYENHRKIKNLTISINHNIKRLAVRTGIKENISTYAARHSFATIAIREGASMEFVSEAFCHSNMKTTQNYFAGFEENTKRAIAESLMNF